jgi:hypothetical protein
VGGQVHPVDDDQRAPLVGGRGDQRDGRAGAQQVRRGGDRDDAGARRQLARHVGHGELGRARVEVGEPHDGADPLGRPHPGADVGVVV